SVGESLAGFALLKLPNYIGPEDGSCYTPSWHNISKHSKTTDICKVHHLLVGNINQITEKSYTKAVKETGEPRTRLPLMSFHDLERVQSPVLTVGLHLCVSQCNNDYVPVCGSNGESYQNECYLRQAACKQQSEILVVSEGSCATGLGSEVDI
ncbi:hypothetical protein P7K49_013850, partial [Saguinus oedipus]